MMRKAAFGLKTSSRSAETAATARDHLPPWEGSGVGRTLGASTAALVRRRPILHYNPKLTSFAKKLRRKMTLAEVLLWKRLNRHQVSGQDFDRQRPVGEWIVDFYCKALRLAVEVDGSVHDHLREKDQARQRSIEALGVKVIRFWNSEVKNDTGGVVKRLEAVIRERARELGVELVSRSERPTADPSQKGKRRRTRASGRAQPAPPESLVPPAAWPIVPSRTNRPVNLLPSLICSPPRRGQGWVGR
jgi:very-short-patch-repair endonuclease